MRKIILLIVSFLVYSVNAQNWISIPKAESFKTSPRHFKVNPYKNQLWFIWDEEVNMIESSGNKHNYTQNELGDLWLGDDLDFAFTKNDIYFSKDIFGLYKFTNEIKELLIDSSEIRKLSSNFDTVYIIMPSQPIFIKYANGTSTVHVKYLSDICAKNEFLYADVGPVARIIGPNLNDWEYLDSDPQYLSAPIKMMRFSRLTDTIFIATPKGISFAYNYDFLDTITPNNTSNMPSPNILEMEFDHLDRLWAVFGDENDQAFAIAMLENDTWINYFDANNSPLQFLHPTGQNGFYGLEIDTLGNIWVCDYANLHTLLSPTTPAWVGLHEATQALVEVYPNPSKEGVTIQFGNLQGEKSAVLLDVKGKKVTSFETAENNYYLSLAGLHKGVYFLEFSHENERYHYKILKE